MDLDFGDGPIDGCSSDCPEGMIWLLGADAEHPWVTRLEANNMGVIEFPLAEILPGFPVAPDVVRIESLHRIVPFNMRDEANQKPFGLVGASSPDGPLYWMVRFAPNQPEVVWGPRTLDIPADVRWGLEVMADPLPHLRPAQEIDKPYFVEDEFRVISLILGEVSEYMVDVEL